MSTSTLVSDKRYVRVDDVVAADMDEEVVMMDVRKGSYFAIGGSGPAIWSRLSEPMRIDELVASLGEEFETGPQEEFEKEVSGFVARLVDQGLVEPVD